MKYLRHTLAEQRHSGDLVHPLYDSPKNWVIARGCAHNVVDRNGTITRCRECKPNTISLKTDSHECEFGTQNPTGLLCNKIQSLYLLAKC
jgi:hypothetical protein